MNEGIINANERRQALHTAVDNDGITQTLTRREWVDHPDTYTITKQGERKNISADQIRHRSYIQEERGFTGRQVVGLDEVKYIHQSVYMKKKLSKKERFNYVAMFSRRCLV